MAKHEVIEVTCDNCRKRVIKDGETVPITLRGKTYESDWCKDCADALERKLVPDELTCHCGYVAKSVRALRQHQTKQSHNKN